MAFEFTRTSFPVGGIWGIFVLIVGLFIESLIVATISNPKGRWALKTGLKETEPYTPTNEKN